MWRDAVTRACASALVLLLLRTTFVHCCGPGRGGTRRRSTRKLMPLIFKEHVPNVYETTLGASGLTEGPITRDISRFQELVPNYNPDIIFRDEEGTGADRLMTERCKERLDTLAISVMNQWPGVRVRVKEAWEEDPTRHSSHSLHFEGRAVDIATSDSDRSKYGLLARLAVEAGFDWVYYEARSHVHCSVKSESPALSRLGGCFPGSGRLTTPTGPLPMSQVRQGDMVAVMGPQGTTSYSPVLMMLHASPVIEASFLQLLTKAGEKLTVTPSHLIMRIRETPSLDSNNNSNSTIELLTKSSSQISAVFADKIVEGDRVLVRTSNGSEIDVHTVSRVTSVVDKGVYAPLTDEGNVIVDDVVVSCYAVIDSQALAHWAFAPVRVYYRIKRVIVKTLETIGIISQEKSNPHLATNITNWKPRLKAADVLFNKSLATPSSNDTKSFIPSEPPPTPSVYIHWYPRMLYSIASYLLPSHLVQL